MIGIYVNSNGCIPYADAIVNGYKTIETRNKNMLSACVGNRVAIIKTRRNKNPMIVGYADITAAARQTGQWLDVNRNLTLIPKGSLYDNNGNSKYCYYLANPEKCDPLPLPKDIVKHGRSWCEF